MSDFLEGILMLAPVGLGLILPFFVLGFIVKSLKNKSLSKKYVKNLVISLVFSIILNILPFWVYRTEIQADENGDYIAFVIFGCFIILALINLLILGLFYTLYYVKLNKNNKEVDNKKPIKLFIIMCLLLIPIIIFLF